MEIVYSSNFNNHFKKNEINLFYGDINDLIELGIDIEGIVYDDNWYVSKFLKFLRNKKRIISIFNYLDIDISMLNKRIKDLSGTDFKWILLAYILIFKYKYIIFDYFDISLIYKDKKKLTNILRKLCDDGINIIVISNDLVFLSNLNKIIHFYTDIDGLVCENLNEIIKLNILPDSEIINFIKLANDKKASLTYTLDSKELLKDIYRGVK